MRNLVVIGAGIGGQLAARGLRDNFPEDQVILIGTPDFNPHGLFYFNEPIPHVAERAIPVGYFKVGDGDAQSYQLKSRGTVSSEVKVSSFDKVGKEEVGYVMDSDTVDLRGVTLIDTKVTEVDLEDCTVQCAGASEKIHYDHLISTVPLPVLVKLVGSSLDLAFKSEPVYEKVVDRVPGESLSLREISRISVYYDTTESQYYRHSQYFKGDEIERSISETIRPVDKTQCHEVALGKIIPSPMINLYVASLESRYDNLALCGRYARWSYHYLVSDTYRDAIRQCRT